MESSRPIEDRVINAKSKVDTGIVKESIVRPQTAAPKIARNVSRAKSRTFSHH